MAKNKEELVELIVNTLLRKKMIDVEDTRDSAEILVDTFGLSLSEEFIDDNDESRPVEKVRFIEGQISEEVK